MKLILLQGLPGSGKSTKAKEIVATGNYYRINRDLLREMLHFNKWTGPNEEITKSASIAVASAVLSYGKNVVIDDTNLSPKTVASWQSWALAQKSVLGKDVEVEIMKIDTPIRECIKRDKERGERGERSVGAHVILNMARQFRIERTGNKDVVSDLDGTLCDIEHRLHFVKKKCLDCGGNGLDGKECPKGGIHDKKQKNWPGFFGAIKDDKLREEVAAKVAAYKDTHNIVLVSARPEECRKETEEWLAAHLPFKYETLIMRKSGDSREDSIVKKEILDTYFDKDNIEVVFDDRPRVIRMWREQGVKVEDVGHGVEF